MRAGTPSRTAQNNAFIRAAETLKPRDLRICDDPYARLFLDPRLRITLQFRFFRQFVLSAWEEIVPGVMNSILARTRFIDDYLQKQVAEGIHQLVILGAGFDTRAYRYMGMKASVRIFELDHPDTQKVKQAKLRTAFGSLPGHVTYVPIDFDKDNLEEKLAANGYDTRLKTLFIWEGVTYYISEKSVDQTLSFIHTFSGSGSCVVFDYLPVSVVSGKCEKPEADRLLTSLRRFGENIIFGISPETIDRFLSDRGFLLTDNISADDYRRLYFNGENSERSVTDIFHLACAVSDKPD